MPVFLAHTGGENWSISPWKANTGGELQPDLLPALYALDERSDDIFIETDLKKNIPIIEN